MTQITEVVFLLRQNFYQSIQNNASIIQFNTTGGAHQISVTVLTELGHSAVLILNLTFDNEPFRITLIDDYDYDVLGQTQIISMTKDIVVKFELIDTNCGNNMTVFLANASLSSYDPNGIVVHVDRNQSSFEIEIHDCVGWRSTSQILIQRKDTVAQETYSNQNQIVIPAQLSTSGVNSSFEMQVTDILNLTVACQTTKGEISCFKIANNSWKIEIQNFTSSGIITFTFNDTIGNMRQNVHNLFSDSSAPSCALNSSESKLHSLCQRSTLRRDKLQRFSKPSH